jgi:hypothetical protein
MISPYTHRQKWIFLGSLVGLLEVTQERVDLRAMSIDLGDIRVNVRFILSSTIAFEHTRALFFWWPPIDGRGWAGSLRSHTRKLLLVESHRHRNARRLSAPGTRSTGQWSLYGWNQGYDS